MDRRLYLNGTQVELPDSEAVALTFRRNDVGEVGELQAGFSNRFNLPLTRINRRALGFADQVNAITDLPYQILTAKYIQEGVPILQRGEAILEEVTEDFVLSVYSGNFSLLEYLGDAVLSDLDLSPFDHQWDWATVTASLNTSTGYLYGIADYGVLPTTANEVNTRALPPVLYVDSIIKRIFAGAPFVVQGNIFSDAFYLKTVVSPTAIFTWWMRGVTNSDEQYLALPLLGYFFFDLLPIPATTFEVNTDGDWREFTEIDPIFLTLVTYWAFEVPEDGQYQFDYFADFLYTTVEGNDITLDVAGTAIDCTTNKRNTKTGTVTVQASAGDKLFFRLVPNLDTFTSLDVYEGTYLRIRKVDPDKQWRGYWKWEDTIGDMKQVDFVKSIFSMFACVPDYDELTQILTVRQLTDVIDNIPTAVDWSGKISLNARIEKETRISGYGQSNLLKYTIDNTTETGEGSFATQDTTLPTSADRITVSFAASDSASYLNDLIYAAKIPFFTSEGTSPETFSASGSPAQRILYAQGQTDSINLTDSSSTTTSTAYKVLKFLDPAQPNNLSFANNLISSYWQAFTDRVFAKPLLLTAFFKLTEVDVQSLDFFTPVFIDVVWENGQINGYFYLNSVNDYTPDELTEVELILIR